MQELTRLDTLGATRLSMQEELSTGIFSPAFYVPKDMNVDVANPRRFRLVLDMRVANQLFTPPPHFMLEPAEKVALRF